MTKAKDELQQIPGIGKSIAGDLREIGIKRVVDLKDRDPEELYDLSNKKVGVIQDPCLLYTFRCAVYFASTSPAKQDPELLKWWHWKNRK